MEIKPMKVYEYDGPVIRFDKMVSMNWQARTTAPSKTRAIKNLVYRFNKENGYTPNTRMILIDGVKEV